MRAAIAAFAAIGLMSTIGVGVANADEPTAPTTVTVGMNFSSFDAGVAASHGFGLRLSPDGTQYVVPLANQFGDWSGAVALPAPVDNSGNIIAPEVGTNNVVAGNCGSSSIFFEGGFGTAYSTSYSYSLAGGTFSHVWRVTAVSDQGSKEYNLDGFAPYGGLGWVSGEKTFSQPGTPEFISVSHGVATGTLGFTCTSGGPVDTR